MRGHLRFLREFVRHPRAIGAVTPSSRRLAREMIARMRPDDGDVFVEYGPGAGSFTHGMLAAVRAPRRFFAVELNPSFARALRRRFPVLSLHEGCASRIREFCEYEGVDGVDGVISGLPWAAFSGELQNRLLESTLGVMRPGARFVTFAYVHALHWPAARKFRRKLEALFPEVEVSDIVWRNLPPAICYTAVNR